MAPNTYTTAALVVSTYGAGKLQGVLGLGSAVDPATNASVVSAANAANSEVDSHLRSRYELPLDSAPDFLVEAATDIAFWHISKRADALASEADSDRIKAARDILKSISKGLMGIDIGDPGDDSGATAHARVATPQVGSSVCNNTDPGIRSRSLFAQSWYSRGKF